eukprot:1390464-Amphidinium_carterae.1
MGKASLASLERAWESKHDLQIATKAGGKRPEIDPPSRCRKLRLCVSGPKGRQLTRMWDRMRVSMRRCFPKPLLQDWLCGGQICLAFRGREPTDPTRASTIHAVHIAYQLLSPWRSTVLAMQIVSDSDRKQLEKAAPQDLETELGVILCPHTRSAGEGFLFMSLEEFTNNLPLAKQWEILPLRLSDRPRIFTAPLGHVKAILLKESPWLVWKGAEAEMAATRRYRTVHGADETDEDVEPEIPDDEYNDIDDLEPMRDMADGLDFASELLDMLTHYADEAPAQDASSTDSSSSSTSSTSDSTRSRKGDHSANAAQCATSS